MTIHVICNESDPASMNIKQFLPETKKFKIVSVPYSLIYEGTNSDMNIFVSKHASEQRINSLTCHAPGNFGPAKYGGEPGTLSISNAKVQTECLRMLHDLNQSEGWNMQVCFEVTHHGPSLKVPCLFVEIGSGPEQWNSSDYGSGIAEVTVRLINDYDKIMEKEQTISIGIGGSHYAPSFTREIIKDEKLSIGHMCPKYAMEYLNIEMFNQMIKKTVPEPTLVLLDKSIKSKMKNEIMNWCKELNLKMKVLK